MPELDFVFAEPEKEVELIKKLGKKPFFGKAEIGAGVTGNLAEVQDNERSCWYLLTTRINCSSGFLVSKAPLEYM